MTLHDRGQYGYRNILVYAKKELPTLFAKSCKTCLNKRCIDCEKHEAFKIDYITNIIVHKLYYSLYKIVKSHLVDDIYAHVSHNWESHENTFLKMLKKSKCTVQQKKECAELIKSFTTLMESLRDYRNSSDYTFFDFYKYLHASIEATVHAHSLFTQIKTYIGEPKC